MFAALTCKAERRADGLEIKAIIEEIGLPDEHGNVSCPVVRALTRTCQGSGLSGDRVRLIDLCEE